MVCPVMLNDDVCILQAHVYKAGSVCAAFLANMDTQSDKTVTFNGKAYKLPAWSVSILPDCKNVVLNTAQVCAFRHKEKAAFVERTSTLALTLVHIATRLRSILR